MTSMTEENCYIVIPNSTFSGITTTINYQNPTTSSGTISGSGSLNESQIAPIVCGINSSFILTLTLTSGDIYTFTANTFGDVSCNRGRGLFAVRNGLGTITISGSTISYENLPYALVLSSLTDVSFELAVYKFEVGLGPPVLSASFPAVTPFFSFVDC